MTDEHPLDPGGELSLDPARGGPRRVALGVILWGVVALLALWASAPPSSLASGAPVTEASGGRAFEVLERLARGGVEAGQVTPPRPIGSEGNAQCRDRILEELRRIGLKPEVHEVQAASARFSCAGTVRNVVCRLPGARTFGPSKGSLEGQSILCMAHYDSVGAGPGIGDDLAGVAALIEVARALMAESVLDRDVILLFGDAEEHGLLGAEAFAAQHPWAHEVGAVINIEGRGTNGPSRLFELGAGNEWLIRAFKGQSSAPSSTSVSAEIYKRMPNDTDYTVWRERGVPGLNFAFIGGVNRYHTPLDDLANLSEDSLQHHVTNALEAVRGLARLESLPRAGEGTPDAVFFDLLGRYLVVYQVRTARILGVLLLLGALLAAARSIRAGAARPWCILLSTVLVLLVVAVGFFAARGENWLYAALGIRTGVAQPAHLGPVLVGLMAAAATGVGIGAFLIGGLCRASEVGSAVTLLFAALAAASAWAAPGASFMFAVPAALLSLGGLALRLRSDIEGRWARTSIVALLVTALLVLTPIHEGLIGAFGVGMPGVAVVPLLLGALLLLPALVGAGRMAALWLGGIGLITAGLTAVMIGQLDLHSPVEPGHLNLVHVEGDGAPRWQIMGASDPVDPALVVDLSSALAQGGGSEVGATYVPWSGSSLAAAKAPATGDGAPTLQILSEDKLQDGGTLFRARVVPGRATDQLRISLTGAHSLVVAGVMMKGHSLRLLGPREEGEEITFQSNRPGAVRIGLWSQQFGLRGVRGRAADAYYDTRPAEYVPFQHGDGSLVHSALSLPDAERISDAAPDSTK